MDVLATSALKRVSRCRRALGRLLARLSTSQKPALWRVCSYSGPGLPRPTIRRMGICAFKSKKNPRRQTTQARVLQFRNRIAAAADYFLALAAGLASAAGAAAGAAASADTWPGGTDAVAMVWLVPWAIAVTPAGRV